MRCLPALIAALLCGPLAPTAVASEPPAAAQQIDPIALATRLLTDGFVDRAQTALAEVDPSAPDLDLGRYHTLRGLIAARQDRHSDAVNAFQAALAIDDANPRIRLQLADSLMRLDRPADGLRALETEGDALGELKATWRLRAIAHERLEQPQQAITALQEGATRFPQTAEFHALHALLLVELGLHQAALDTGRQVLDTHPDDVDTALAMATALRSSGAHRQAVDLLEELRLRVPGRADVYTALARAWLDAGSARAAADVLRVGAELDAERYLQAAEVYRQAGDLPQAFEMNRYVTNATDKARQRLGLYAESGEWVRVAAMTPRLVRLGLAEDDAVAYALAYAHFQMGQASEAETWLKTLDAPRWFADATALRDALASCADQGSCS